MARSASPINVPELFAAAHRRCDGTAAPAARLTR